MTLETRTQIQNAIDSKNWYDLYDALADNGLETDFVYAKSNPGDIDWLTEYATSLLNLTRETPTA